MLIVTRKVSVEHTFSLLTTDILDLATFWFSARPRTHYLAAPHYLFTASSGAVGRTFLPPRRGFEIDPDWQCVREGHPRGA